MHLHFRFKTISSSLQSHLWMILLQNLQVNDPYMVQFWGFAPIAQTL